MTDFRAEKPHRVDKPWGYELWLAHTDKYAGKVIFVKKGSRLSLQYHQKKDETVYVYSGELLMQMGESENKMSPLVLKEGEYVRIKPATRHRMEALRDTFFFEVSTPELDDVVRLQDDYGRADKTV